MTTSGTVGLTTLDTAKVIEHAFRRVKVHPSKQTPEKVQLAKDNLYLLLTNLSNRGLNLWAVEKRLVGGVAGQAVYQCPVGTVDLLNLVFSQPSRVTGTDTVASTSVVTDLGAATDVVRIGLKFSAIAASETVTLAYSSDNVTYTTAVATTATDWAAGTWYWVDMPKIETAQYFRVSTTAAITVAEFYLATSIYDLPMTSWNRDTYSVINNKMQQGTPSTTYFFEKLVQPQVTIWPVPNSDYNHLTMYCHRQIQDVGTLTQTLELPARWYEAIIWELAVRLAFELDEVQPQLIQAIQAMADKFTNEAEQEESDGMPLFISPTIRGYTR